MFHPRRTHPPKPGPLGLASMLLLLLVLALPTAASAGHDRSAASPTADPTDGAVPAVGTAPVRADAVVRSPESDRADPDRRIDLEAVRIDPRLTAGGRGRRAPFSDCFVDFNDDGVLSILPYQAIHNTIEWPFWNQYCSPPSSKAIAVEPIGSAHYHIGYVDTAIRFCTDLGTFGRPLDADDPASPCSAIDPLTEPRSGVSPHGVGYGLRVYAYDTGTKERLQFTMNELRVLSGEITVCFVHSDGPWISPTPVSGHPGTCGELGVGTWDVSATVTDVHEVRLYADSANYTVTDIGLRTLP